LIAGQRAAVKDYFPEFSRRLQPFQFGLEFKAQLRAFGFGQEVRHLRKNGAVERLEVRIKLFSMLSRQHIF
jgi:hypothetical protein